MDMDFTTLWDDYRPTRLLELPALAQRTRVGRVFVKVEGERPLGNFKILGGMVAGLRALARAGSGPRSRLICASDGNHGLSVAIAARRGGAKATVYLPEHASAARAARIEALGGEVVRIAGTYDEAVSAAAEAAARGEGLLISDTSPDPDDPVANDVMSGYGLLTRELIAQFRDEAHDRPTHVFVQAGVGGLAAAVAEGLADILREPKGIAVVEPQAAACVARALQAGRPVLIDGDLHTAAEMLAGGLASAAALKILRRHDVQSVVVNEEELLDAVDVLRKASGPDTTPSGAAGLAGLLHVAAHPHLRETHRLEADSSVLLIATEGPLPIDR
jgi:diaminopropionate ammonia-lyase